MRGRHGDNGVYRIRLVVGRRKDGSGDNATHGMTNENDRARVWKPRVSPGSAWVVVQRKYVSHGFVDVISLVEHCLPVESSKVFVEVDRGKVETPRTCANRVLVMPNNVMPVSGGLR